MSHQPTQTQQRQADWNHLFQQRAWGRYPADELIRFVAKHYYAVPDRSTVQVLDLGCGTGANTWYLACEGFSVTAVDGSETALEITRKRLAETNLRAELQHAFLTDLPFEDNSFDVVLDQACMTCNPWREAEAMVQEVKRILKPGGRFYSALLGQETTLQGKMVEPHYYEEILSGALQGVPSTRLYSEEDVYRLFQPFEAVGLEYQLRTFNQRQERVQQWIVQAVCPD